MSHLHDERGWDHQRQTLEQALPRPYFVGWHPLPDHSSPTLTDPVWPRNCACGYSPDGKWIVSASADKTLKVWKVLGGQCVLTYPVDGALFDCAFHPDGAHLVVSGDAGMYFLRLVK